MKSIPLTVEQDLMKVDHNIIQWQIKLLIEEKVCRKASCVDLVEGRCWQMALANLLSRRATSFIPL